MEAENKNVSQRLDDLTLRDDGFTDLKGPNWYKQGQWEARKLNAKDYLMNHVHFCHNFDQAE